MESHVKARVLLAIGALPGVRMFNSPTGEGWQGKLLRSDRDTVLLSHPRRIRFGLVKGGSDIVGWTSRVITPDMVGTRVAIFTVIEVKTETGSMREGQQPFIDAVNGAGGIAGVVRTPEQALDLVRLAPAPKAEQLGMFSEPAA